MELLKKLCSISAASGNETGLRNFITEEIKGFCESYETDPLGNLIVFKKGEKTPQKKMMIAAHMDEVGFIVNYIEKEGLLRFKTVGGISPSVSVGHKVIFENGTIGTIIPSKATHQLSSEERTAPPSFDDLFIDIGALSKEDAEKEISIGDTAVFYPEWIENDESVFSKALDDRIGVFTMINIIKGSIPFDAYFVFTVQEEVGLRGAATAAFSVAPDIALVIDSTTANDLPDQSGCDRVCLQNEGAVISFMDNSTVYDKDLWKKILEISKKHGIKAQLKTKVAGGNDAGSIHRSRGGVKTAAISAPCRYIHSGLSLVRKCDIEAIERLVLTLLGELL